MYYRHRCQSPVKTTCSFFPLSRGQLLCIGHCKTYAKIGSSQMSLADCWTARPVLKLPSSLALFFTCLPSLANDEFRYLPPPIHKHPLSHQLILTSPIISLSTNGLSDSGSARNSSPMPSVPSSKSEWSPFTILWLLSPLSHSQAPRHDQHLLLRLMLLPLR